MKKIFRKIPCVLIFSLAILQIFTLCAVASAEPLEWEMSEDGRTLYYDDEYVLYKSNRPLYPIAEDVYVYTQDVFYVTNIEKNRQTENAIVWVENDQFDFYVTEDGKKDLDDFLSGEIGSFLLSEKEDFYFNADIDASTVKELDEAYKSGESIKAVDVKELSELEAYHVLATDRSDTVACVYGAIYFLGNGAAYYLPYSALENRNFDADGNFSYREGEVNVSVIRGKLLVNVADTRDEIEENYPYYTWEGDELLFGEIDKATAVVLFWICFIFLGFILPIPFLVIGLVFPRSEKNGRPRYWYILSIISGIWILLSAILLLLIILI